MLPPPSTGLVEFRKFSSRSGAVYRSSVKRLGPLRVRLFVPRFINFWIANRDARLLVPSLFVHTKHEEQEDQGSCTNEAEECSLKEETISERRI